MPNLPNTIRYIAPTPEELEYLLFKRIAPALGIIDLAPLLILLLCATKHKRAVLNEESTDFSRGGRMSMSTISH